MPVSRSRKRKSAKNNPDADKKYKKCYKRSYAPTAKKMCQLGATTADLAQAFGVTANVIILWQTTYKQFADACGIGGEKATDRVESSLYQLACGYDIIEPKVVKLGGEIVIVDTPKHIPANVSAARLWLFHRIPDRYTKDAEHVLARMRKEALRRLFKEIEGHVLRPVENPPDDPYCPPRFNRKSDK